MKPRSPKRRQIKLVRYFYSYEVRRRNLWGESRTYYRGYGVMGGKVPVHAKLDAAKIAERAEKLIRQDKDFKNSDYIHLIALNPL